MIAIGEVENSSDDFLDRLGMIEPLLDEFCYELLELLNCNARLELRALVRERFGTNEDTLGLECLVEFVACVQGGDQVEAAFR